MYSHVTFEISGGCNARCKWCVTGRANREGRSPKARFIDPAEFARAVDYLRANKMINGDAVFFLYNWGEPLLHPRFKDIVAVLNERDIEYVISTNLSKLVEFEPGDELRNLRAVVVSMPGFSQASYDRIHGFNFQRIKSNILHMQENFTAAGFKGKVQLSYHVYQFSLEEVPDALAFAQQHNLGIKPTWATFADLSKLFDYVSGEMPYQELKEASSELILNFLEESTGKMPAGYECSFHDVLLLDEGCNVVTCCVLTKEMPNFVIGNLFDLSLEDIRRLKRCQPVCKRCMELEIPYLVAQRGSPAHLEVLDLSVGSIPADRPLYIWGTGGMAQRLAQRGREGGPGHDLAGFLAENDVSPVEFDGLPVLSAKEVLALEPKPFVVVANEHIRPMVAELEAKNYKRGDDFAVMNMIGGG